MNRDNMALPAEGHKKLFNSYAVMVVDPAGDAGVKAQLARQSADRVVSTVGQATIASYKIGGQ